MVQRGPNDREGDKRLVLWEGDPPIGDTGEKLRFEIRSEYLCEGRRRDDSTGLVVLDGTGLIERREVGLYSAIYTRWRWIEEICSTGLPFSR